MIDDLRMLSLVRGVARIPQRRRTDEGAMRHGDAAIAGCLAHSASRMPVQIYGYEGPPKPRREGALHLLDDTFSEDNLVPGSGMLPVLPALGSLF